MELMTTARDQMLRRIRTALSDVPADTGVAAIPREYRQAEIVQHDEVVALFARRVAEYRATVHRVTQSDLQTTVAAACLRRGARHLIVPADLPADWLPPGLDIVRDDGRDADALNRCDGVVTGCALGIAQTGTIVLDGGVCQGRRAITLLPDYHLCVVVEAQIVAIVPEAMTRLGESARTGRPLTLISGPSATSDIELNRVEGVHGPRTLEVLVVAP
ncbi:MAG: LUD domain-containing protein [Chloroflexota bacterium]